MLVVSYRKGWGMEAFRTLVAALEEWGFDPQDSGRGVIVPLLVGDDRVVAVTLASRTGFELRVVAREQIATPRRVEAEFVLRSLEIPKLALDRDGRITLQMGAVEVTSWLSAVGVASKRIGQAFEALRTRGIIPPPRVIRRRDSLPPPS
jgi:hypothetical protein